MAIVNHDAHIQHAVGASCPESTNEEIAALVFARGLLSRFLLTGVFRWSVLLILLDATGFD
jgi:hypothetical protein